MNTKQQRPLAAKPGSPGGSASSFKALLSAARGSRFRALRAAGRRRGFIVLVVMIVIVMVTLAGLSFVMTLSTENKAVHRQGDQLQLDEALSCGVELIKAFCSQSAQNRAEAGGTLDNAGVFGDVGIAVDGGAEAGLRLSILSPHGEESPGETPRYGLQNESARLHLGALIEWEQREPGAATAALLQLPGMSEATAAAILDWIDADGQTRPGGAEAEYYADQGLPYEPRNGVPALLEELLLIRDVSRELLLGADANRGFPAASGESPPAFSTAVDVREQDSSWAQLLTVYSAERNTTFDGRPRINLNEPDLNKLHGQLTEALERPWADFVVAYRQYGPTENVPVSGPRRTRRMRTAGDARSARSGRRTANEVPLDLSVPAKHDIECILDLVGAAVVMPLRPDAPEGEPPAVVFGPLPDDPQALRDQLPRLADLTTTTGQQVLYGRVNVNEAPRSVLLGIPGLDPAVVDRILALRSTVADATDLGRRHALWLVTEGLVDRPTMRALWPYVTGGGDVFRARIAVRRSDSGRMARADAVVDAAVFPPRLVYWKSLSLLSSGPVPAG